MRFPHEALLRIQPVSPLSDEAPDTSLYGVNIYITCIAGNKSGTNDPDVQFSGQDVISGAFGDLIDVTIKARSHRQLRDEIATSKTPFSAQLMLRLYAIYERTTIVTDKGMVTSAIRDLNLMDNSATLDASRSGNFRGYPLDAIKIYPTLTVMTFNAKRVLL